MSGYQCFGPVKEIKLKETSHFPERTCYDIYAGKEERCSTDNDVQLFKDALVNKNLLFRWAQIASQIFQSHPDSYWNHSGKSWEENFCSKKKGSGLDYTEPNYMDLIDCLCNKKDRTRGDDVHMSSGLVLASSLEEVETAAGKMAQDLLKRKLKGPQFIERADLDLLHGKKLSSNKVYYTLAGFLDRYGKTFQFGYTVFGIVFYDFKLKVVSDGSQYNTAIGDKTIEEAKTQTIPGFSYQESNFGTKTISSAENKGTSEITQTVEKTIGNSRSESNSITKSEEYSFTESIGLEVGLSKVIPLADVTMKLGFEAAQVIGTAYSEEKSVSKSEENTSSVTVTVPAHTAVVVTQHESTSTVKLEYDCPVMIQYSAAVFSICGTCYDDKAAVHTFKTSGYDQRSFVTIFAPSKAGTEAEDAVDNLYLRYQNRDVLGYEKTFGETKLKSHNRGTLEDTLNWGKINGQSPVSTRCGGSDKGQTEASKKPGELIQTLCENRPMAPTGAVLTDSGNQVATEVCDAIPLYPLNKICLVSGSTQYDTGINADFNTNNWVTQGVDEAGVNFYGYIHDKGEWVLTDEYGEELTDTSIAYWKEDSITKERLIHTAGKGTVYAKYLIPENYYTCQSGEPIDNKSIQTVKIRIEIHDTTLDGRIEVEGHIEAKKDSVVNLEEMNSHVHVYDEMGREITVPVTWEAAPECREEIVIVNNRMTPNKTGVFHIRACYESLASDWIEVIVTM